MRQLCILTISLCLAAGSVTADVVGPGGKTIDCYCTDKSGARIELGETICLQVDGRMFMAQCQMSLNVPMWRKVSDGCLNARLAPGGDPFKLRKPLVNTRAIYPKI